MTELQEKPQRKRFWFLVSNLEQWYSIMRECRSWFGRDWGCQGRVHRRLSPNGRARRGNSPVEVWFEVPDERFATWASVKLSLQVQSDRKRNANK